MRDLDLSQHPTIRPGQVWLAEQAGSALHPLDHEALLDANVVIYARSLAPLVAQLLPMGAYAEPLPPEVPPGRVAPRALRFAAEGWSVVQLTEACPGSRARLRDAGAALIRSGIPGEMPVQTIVKPLVRSACISSASVRDLIDLSDEPGTHPLTLVFGPFAMGHPSYAHLFTAHGLAG